MPQLSLQLKKLGKKKIKTVAFPVDQYPETLSGLITECIRSEVKRYNEQRTEIVLSPFLGPAEIGTQSETGKIGFGDISNITPADEKKALENAMLAFKDGLFLVFIDNEEFTDPEAALQISEHTVITFIRMTFLTGTYW